VHTVQFYAGSTLIGQDTSAPYEFNWACSSEAQPDTFTARVIFGPTNAYVDSASVKVSLTDLPAPWAPVAIGSNSIAARARFSNDVFTVEGAGTLLSKLDNFQFVHQPLLGDGEIIIRLDNVTSTNTNARMGIMVRENLTPASRYVFLGVSPDGVVRAMYRTQTGALPGSYSINPNYGAPNNFWLRLVRKAGQITSYFSMDGQSWKQVTSTKVTMATNISMGMAVSSGTALNLDSVQFSSPTAVP
jgi:hypothetical protein